MTQQSHQILNDSTMLTRRSRRLCCLGTSHRRARRRTWGSQSGRPPVQFPPPRRCPGEDKYFKDGEGGHDDILQLWQNLQLFG